MFTRRSILSHSSYWLTEIRMDLMRAVGDYMDAHHLNRRQLAQHLACSPGYVSQMLNGDTNVSLEKLCEVAVAVGKAPRVRFDDLEATIERDALLTESFHLSSTTSGSVQVRSSKPARSIHFAAQGELVAE